MNSVLANWIMISDKKAKVYSHSELYGLVSGAVKDVPAKEVIRKLITDGIVAQSASNYYGLTEKGLKLRCKLPLVYEAKVQKKEETVKPVNPEEWNKFRKVCSYYAECVQYNERRDNYIRIEGDKCSLNTVKHGCSVYYIPPNMPYGWLQKPEEGLSKVVELRYDRKQEFAIASIKSFTDEVETFLGYPLVGHRSKDYNEVYYTAIIQIPVEEVPNKPYSLNNTISFKLDFEHAFLNPQWVENTVPLENRGAIEKLEEKCSQIREDHMILDLQELVSLAVSMSYQADEGLDIVSPDQVRPIMRGDRRHQLFNTAVIFQAKNLQYSKVLKKELDYIANVATDSELDNTALAYIFRKHPFEPKMKTAVSIPFISTNQEQGDAVELSEESGVAVVQGPPGTGKTQMAVNLIANCVFNGESVLFTSTNHQAINAIRERSSSLFEDIPLVNFCADADGNFTQSWFDIDLTTENSKAILSKDSVSDENLYTDNAVRRLLDIKEKYSIWNGVYSEYTSCEEEYENCLRMCLSSLKVTSEKLSLDGVSELFGKEKILMKDRYSFFDRVLFRVKRLRRQREEALAWLKNAFPILYDENFSQFSSSSASFPEDLKKAREYLKKVDELQKKLAVLEDKIEKLPDWDEGFREFSSKLSQLSSNCQKAFLFRYYNRLGEGLSEDRLEELETFQKNNSRQRGFDKAKNHSGKLRLLKTQDDEYDSFLSSLKDIYKVHPAWAVTLQSVSRAYPCVPGIVDQVIVDESSQCLPAYVIPAMFRAKRIVVVGDEKQFKPITQIKEKAHKLLLERYKISDEERSLYFTENSAYDIAQYHLDRSKYKLMLKEHFRCSEEIASFINDTVYSGRMRIRSGEHGFNFPQNCGYKHAVEWVDVCNDKEGEIDAVIERLRTLVKNEYKGSIGIISPLRVIANEINERLYQEGLSQYVDKCSTAYSYQGGEQDLIIFVLGLNNETQRGQRWYIEGGGEDSENILNVAISRAKALLLVIGDKEQARASQSRIIRKLASYNPGGTNPEPTCESKYEYMLVDELEKQRIPHQIQYPLVGRRLDVAVICDTCKIDVEVDGVHFHTNSDGYRKLGDMQRDNQVMAAGWLVLRFWSYDLRDRMDACIKRIKETMTTGKVSDEIIWRRSLMR